MLFAQQAPVAAFSWTLLLLLIGVVGALLMLTVVGWMVMRQVRSSRQLLHTERTRAIEAGIGWEPPGESEPAKLQGRYMHNAFWVAFWVGFGVPVAAFYSAAGVVRSVSDSVAIAIVAWISAGVASTAAVVSAAIIMWHSRNRGTGKF